MYCQISFRHHNLISTVLIDNICTNAKWYFQIQGKNEKHCWQKCVVLSLPWQSSQFKLHVTVVNLCHDLNIIILCSRHCRRERHFEVERKFAVWKHGWCSISRRCLWTVIHYETFKENQMLFICAGVSDIWSWRLLELP